MAWWKLHSRPKYEAYDQGGGQVGYHYAGSTVIASAALVSKDQVRTVVGRKQDWQAEGWELYHAVPELRSGVTWAANGCSRVRLYVGKIDPDGSSKPLPVSAGDEDADQELVAKLLAPLAELGGGQLGQSEMLRRLSVHLDVPGESYVVGFDDPSSGERRWLVCSPSEVSSAAGGGAVRIQLPESPTALINLPLDQCTLLRIWRPDAELAYLADSPLRSLREPLRELQGLSAHVLATVESRLAGAGLMMISDDVTPASPQHSDGANPIHADPVTAALIEAMATPLKNRDSASAIVPLLLKVQGSPKDKLLYQSFATELDANLLPLRDAAVRRTAIGLDMPAEILLGVGDVNHWGAWLIDENGVKLHIEPKLGLICDALTSQFYRPALEALGVPDSEQYAIWYDTTDLKQRPNRGPEALQAFKEGLIGAVATRRELGFSDEDAPTDDERNRMLVQEIVQAAPSLAPSLLPFLGIRIPETEAAAAVAEAVTEDPDAAVANAPAAQAVPAPPSRPAISAPAPASSRPEPPARQAAAALTASGADWRISCLDMAARRALERAGQWLLNRGGRSLRGQFRDVPLHQIHVRLAAEQGQLDAMLVGAYREFHAATPDEPCLHRALDHYVRALLLAREEHHREYLARAIAQAGCDQGAA
jgi:hypothetical protein